jgi:hypothetical protein
MGYGISWVAIRDNKENALLDVLGLEKTGESDDTPDSEWSTTRIGDWTVVWSNRFEPKKFRHARSKLKGEVIICDVEEHIMYSSVAAFNDGDLSWRVCTMHSRQSITCRLRDRLRTRSPRSKRSNLHVSARVKLTIFSTFPIRLAPELVGFRYDDPVERTFEVLRSKPGWKFW